MRRVERPAFFPPTSLLMVSFLPNSLLRGEHDGTVRRWRVHCVLAARGVMGRLGGGVCSSCAAGEHYGTVGRRRVHCG